jgi:NTP pyrophosphatase (non-canonical NTP hydrolase)
MKMNQLRDMTDTVLMWIRQHLPDSQRDPVNTSIKLSEEASELTHAIYTGGDVGEECADILILLLDIIYLCDVDIEGEFMAKMDTNYNRRWVKEKGAMKHDD